MPGYDQVLGHEFVGKVESCPSEPSLIGQRVVGEINCRCHDAQPHADAIFERNHSHGRTVLGIIGKDVSPPLLPSPFQLLHMHNCALQEKLLHMKSERHPAWPAVSLEDAVTCHKSQWPKTAT